MIPMLEFSNERPILSAEYGETHYPYATPDEPENEWPVIPVHGVFKRAGEQEHAL